MLGRNGSGRDAYPPWGTRICRHHISINSHRCISLARAVQPTIYNIVFISPTTHRVGLWQIDSRNVTIGTQQRTINHSSGTRNTHRLLQLHPGPGNMQTPISMQIIKQRIWEYGFESNLFAFVKSNRKSDHDRNLQIKDCGHDMYQYQSSIILLQLIAAIGTAV